MQNDNRTMDVQSICLAILALACIMLIGLIALRGGSSNTTASSISGSLMTLAAGAIGAIAGAMNPKSVQTSAQSILAPVQSSEPLQWGVPSSTGEPTVRMPAQTTPYYEAPPADAQFGSGMTADLAPTAIQPNYAPVATRQSASITAEPGYTS